MRLIFNPAPIPSRTQTMNALADPPLTELVRHFARLPGLGPRSARRIVFALLSDRHGLLQPLIEALTQAHDQLTSCVVCGNVDLVSPCAICTDLDRDQGLLCVVERIPDLWAIERAGEFHGVYHVLGGTLSVMEGATPQTLGIDRLAQRVHAASDPRITPPDPKREHFPIREVILATNVTLEGQMTAHYIARTLASTGVRINALARGIPSGGELDYVDPHTLANALAARRPLTTNAQNRLEQNPPQPTPPQLSPLPPDSAPHQPRQNHPPPNIPN